MIGNVREWAFNERGDERVILGGAWNDESAFYNPRNIQAAVPPFDRSATNGVRVILTNDTPAVRDSLRRPARVVPPRDPASELPVTDAEFEILRRMYAYERSPLNATTEFVDSVLSRLWIRERISLDATYGGERLIVYLYRPRSMPGPYQTVVYYPGAPAFFSSSIDEYRELHLDFVIRTGRALAFPVYQSTFERRGKSLSPRVVRLQHVNDLRRTIDYLSTRADVDTSRLAYYGYSAGGPIAPLFLVLEPRLRAAVLNLAGLEPFRRRFPEIETMVFLPRVRTPVVMFSGELDDQFPLESSAKPFFQLLGTPAKDKKLIIAPGSHFIEDRSLFIRESMNWLDRYLGPVSPAARPSGNSPGK
jgi:dienelactone hydrolase